jgi:site-specific DNA-methyltransferase (adenine-specific)
MADSSVDSIVCDPPYELGFMGKSWDSTGIAYSVELWRECLRVLKPGGHILAFGGSRTWHRLAVAIEDAGFELRDSIAWLYGSGFPKSLDISKAIDKAAGAVREVVTDVVSDLFGEREVRREKEAFGIGNTSDTFSGHADGAMFRELGDPITADAKKWQGWGTALKPAFEPIVVGRKPLIGTVAANVLEWGVGGLNIDASRIGTEVRKNNVNDFSNQHGNKFGNGERIEKLGESEVTGRWPANIILDEYTAELLDEQSGVGISKSGGMSGRETASVYGQHKSTPRTGHDDAGGASRFFYVAKASKRDRNEGLDALEPQRHSDQETADGVGGDNPRNRTNHAKQNFHPTVKPTDLMRYLIKLVTPEGGLVLDPFTGSGSTGKAALLDGYKFAGIEMTADYLPIIQGRLDWAEQQANQAAEKESETLF